MKQVGQITLLVTIVLSVVIVYTVSLISGSLTFFQNSKYSLEGIQATNLAEAGIDKAVASLNVSGGTYSGESEKTLGVGTYEVTVASVDPSTSKIVSTGYIPDKSNVKIKRSVEIIVSKGIGASFNYGLQVGDGGLTIAKDSIIDGSVYSNGNITMAQNTRITGDAYVAGGTAPTPDQSADCVSPNCSDFLFGKSVGGQTQLDVAQSFKPGVSSVLNKVAIKLKKFGSPPNVTVRIMGDSSGKPNKGQILASGTLNASLVTNQYSFVEVALTAPPTLNQDTTYWIMVDTSSDSSNYWFWSNDVLQSYTRGSAAWSPNWNASNPAWNSISGDLGFKTYMGGQSTYIQGATGVTIQGDAHANTLIDLIINGGAYYQVAQNIAAGNSYPSSPDPQVQSMPISDAVIESWKGIAQNTGVFTGDIISCQSNLVAGKYIGSITIPAGCTTTVGSPIWITGDLNLGNKATVKLNSSFGSSSGVVMVDNFVTLDKDGDILGSDTNGSYLILISNFNTRDDPQQRNAIDVAKEGNSGILYSNLGAISIAKENHMTQITSWKLIIAKETSITYDQGLAGAFFTSGPSGAYSILKGTYQSR